MGCYDDELNAARSLSRVAGHIIMYHYERKAHAEQHIKSIRRGHGETLQEPVTLADRDADAFIRKELGRLFPEDGVISEEHVENIETVKLDMGRERYWCVDPLDGTREFLENKVFEFCVMIALVEGDRPVLGVVWNPGTGEEYFATAGKGAYICRNEDVKRLTVSGVERLSDARIVASRSHFPQEVFTIAHAAGVSGEKIVRMGSIGVKTGILSEARADLYLHTKRSTKIWDTAAPEVILRESGGCMSDILGHPIQYRREVRGINDLFVHHGIVASNGLLHDTTVRLLKDLLTKGEIAIQP